MKWFGILGIYDPALRSLSAGRTAAMVAPRSRTFASMLAKAKPKPNRKVAMPRIYRGSSHAMIAWMLLNCESTPDPASAASRTTLLFE